MTDLPAIITRYALASCLVHDSVYNPLLVLDQAFLKMAESGADARQIGLKALQQIEAELKDAETYQRQLGYNVHALYSRAMNLRQFLRDTGGIIETQLTEAWKSGADEMMVLPEDMTPEDNAYIKKLITDEKKFLDGFASDIQDASADQAGWEKFKPRISMWVNRLNDVENQARMYFANEKDKFEWVLGPTEKHCHQKNGKWGCAELAGIVATKTQWDKFNLHPQGTMLVCNGKHCLCRFVPTRKRRTPKAIDKINAARGMA